MTTKSPYNNYFTLASRTPLRLPKKLSVGPKASSRLGLMEDLSGKPLSIAFASRQIKVNSLSNVVDPARPYQDVTLTRHEFAAVDAADGVGHVTVSAAIPGLASELPRIAKSASTDLNYRYTDCTSGNGRSAPGTAVPIGRLGNELKAEQAAFFGSLAKTDWNTRYGDHRMGKAARVSQYFCSGGGDSR
ncbi:unnamed protein product [Clonostachys rhizophaga]|uniref:Uncharacterized protein n=1 Tax=Clonostachys rhizophaga TaxID=160324 RepID=A0A9N9VF31_9HYPO|nr:unnamed protein product [Clonostachys rhizophaga]